MSKLGSTLVTASGFLFVALTVLVTSSSPIAKSIAYAAGIATVVTLVILSVSPATRLR